MFRNIGRKVRGLAVALCVIGILGSIGAGVFLYLTRLLELIPCIAIAAGGVLVSWLSSWTLYCIGEMLRLDREQNDLGFWTLYCIGDTHVRIERLEEKLIPKPAYAEYLAGNNPARGKCEICGRTTDLIDAKIEDKMGVRYRRVCRECFAANNCQERD